nr:MAG TPA: hypothetical protein [Caudoviricetes sp.]
MYLNRSHFFLLFSFLSTQQNHTYVAFVISLLKNQIMLYLCIFTNIYL